MDLDPYKTYDSGEISPYVLKKCVGTLDRPLDKLFRHSVEEGSVPREWKEAYVTIHIHTKISYRCPLVLSAIQSLTKCSFSPYSLLYTVPLHNPFAVLVSFVILSFSTFRLQSTIHSYSK